MLYMNVLFFSVCYLKKVREPSNSLLTYLIKEDNLSSLSLSIKNIDAFIF